MADNLTVSEGAGKTIAADEISSVLHQRVKVQHGADGSATDVSTASALPVRVYTPNGDSAMDDTNDAVRVNVVAAVGGDATAANQTTMIASLSVLDDWDETDRAKVNPIVGQAGVAAGAGAVGATVQRTTLASDDPAVTALQLIDDAIVADDAAFTPATTKVMMVGFEFDDTTPDSVDEGDAGAARMSANRNIFTQIRDAAGNERGANVNASNQLAVAGPVTNAGTFVVQENGAALTALQVIDDWDESDRAKVNPIVGQAGVAAGNGPVGATVQRVAIADYSAGEYETVAASQTAQVLGATGATGDFLAGVLVVPATTSPGNVLILDNATSITVFAGGASSVSNLVPFFIPLGMISVSGAWKITTGANVSCIGIGNFT